MDVSPSAAVNATLAMQQAGGVQAVQVAVLKKAMDVQASSALSLLQALPGNLPLAPSGPLGTQVNTLA